MTQKTVRLTMAQAVVRYLCNQYTLIDGEPASRNGEEGAC